MEAMTPRDELIAALLPFAEAGRALEGRGFSDGHEAPSKFTIGMLRRASKALQQAQSGGEVTVTEEAVRTFANELRKWWSFDDGQVHTHTWHSREDFIAEHLRAALSASLKDNAATTLNQKAER